MSKGTYERAMDILRERREKVLTEATSRRNHAVEMVPELAVIDRELENTMGFQVLGAGLNGGDLDEKIAKLRESANALLQRKKELLASVGLAPDYYDEKWVCPECNDTGRVKGKMCHCLREILASLRLETSGLGKLMMSQSFESFSPDYYSEEIRENIIGHRDTLRRWAENFTGKGNYILTGGTGLGKTHLSTSVAKAVIRRGYDVVYTTADEFFGDFQKERFGDGDGDTERFNKCDLLIIDDLGTEVTNRFIVSCLYNVINARINSDKATLISTNLTGREISDRYEERTASRIFGYYTPLIFTGKDIRRQKLAN